VGEVMTQVPAWAGLEKLTSQKPHLLLNTIIRLSKDGNLVGNTGSCIVHQTALFKVAIEERT